MSVGHAPDEDAAGTEHHPLVDDDSPARRAAGMKPPWVFEYAGQIGLPISALLGLRRGRLPPDRPGGG
jgi:hypothetical protein